EKTLPTLFAQRFQTRLLRESQFPISLRLGPSARPEASLPCYSPGGHTALYRFGRFGVLSAQSVMSNKIKIKKDHKHGPAMPCRIAATRECERWPRWMRKGSQMGRAIPLHASQPRQTHGALLDAPSYERNSVPAGAGCRGKSGRFGSPRILRFAPDRKLRCVL